MKKIIILIPVYNDWDSLIKVIDEIDEIVKKFKDISFECLIVNDASSIESFKISKPSNIKSITILNMRVNKGHARCNAFGLRFICKTKEFDYLILMDGDGEDRPVEIESLVKKALKNPGHSVVAKRIKRSEGFIFQLMYQVHKLITYIFTGKKINFGNYSCLTNKDVNLISSKPSLWSSFSGTLKKNIYTLKEIESERGSRYFGPSKMSLLSLLIHSFSIIAVFKYRVFARSFLIAILLWSLKNYLNNFVYYFLALIISFNLLIFLTSLRENKDALNDSQSNLKSEDVIAH